MKLLPRNLHGYKVAVITAACLSLTQAKPSDPCAAIAGKSIATFHEAKACLQHFPFDESVANQTLDTVRRVATDLYVFNEIAASPPQVEGLSVVPVNITYGLDVIKNTKWHSDQEFHDAVALLLDKVHDAHLVYSPFCYRQFVFWQPIQLNALIRHRRLVINVAYVKTDIWPDAKESWTGCEVTHIDEREALDMVVDYAVNNNGESKDVNTCLNNIMNTKSYFHGWDDGADDLGYHRFLPAQEMHSYTLRCPKNNTQSDREEYDEPFTVKVPWVAQVPQGFSDANSYWNKYCQSSHANMRKRNLASSDNFLDVDELKMIHEGQAFDLSPEAINGVGGRKGPYAQFIPLKGENSKVGVIDIQSFSISSEDRQEFVNNFTAGLKQFEKDGIEKIILDLSSNGGGDACAGEFMINTFFGSTPDYPSDVKYSPFLERVVKKAYETQATKWIDYRSDKYKGSDWYTHTVSYTRGKEQVKFSQPISLSCATWNDELSNVKYNNTKWKASDILILSDGRCGSTCAIVASRLRLSHKVPAMGLGGIRGNRMQFASFPGGESERLSGFLMDLQALDLQNDPDAPAPFPIRADMGWTFREVYKPGQVGNEKDLLEYSVNNADCRMHFDDENADDVEKLWADVAQVLLNGQCPLI
ncbi:uncharacterized protein BYT42DRAFT_553508 [Radiomyces spectabilis]|uniref:uncharacterized protein n=1 Tax=Radiomyces spectabilis TaxID=64574 RepID=UPI002220F14B|nr:uncharacterized protein BYT42DRAFT_553508 [Radiomyces spectabilis]KAI8394135.1 hypothetical protein BYT42DRAFT_553508 [Radiomyces spectabilis]